MANNNCILLAVVVLLVLFSTWRSTSAQYSGTASFSSSSSPRSCSGIDPENYMVAAVRGDLYNKGAGCGIKYTITCVGSTDNPCLPNAKPITVTVADDCKPEAPDYEKCPTFVMPANVFAAIAPLNSGVVKVSYQLAAA